MVKNDNNSYTAEFPHIQELTYSVAEQMDIEFIQLLYVNLNIIFIKAMYRCNNSNLNKTLDFLKAMKFISFLDE